MEKDTRWIAYFIVVVTILAGLFAGCVTTNEEEIRLYAREFIRDYIKNPETIEYRNETIIPPYGFNSAWDVYGVGTVDYEGSREIFTYHIYGEKSYDGKLNGVLKQLSIGD